MESGAVLIARATQVTNGYFTTITFDTVPSDVFPRNRLLLADSAVPEIAVVLLKKSLFVSRIVPPETFAPTTLLENMLLETFTWQPVFARTAPFPPFVAAKTQFRTVTKALDVVLTPLAIPLKRQLSISARDAPELVVIIIPVVMLSKLQSSTLRFVEVAVDAWVIPVVLKFSKVQFSTISCAALM